MNRSVRGTVMKCFPCATEPGTDVVTIGIVKGSRFTGGEIVDLFWDVGECEYCEYWAKRWSGGGLRTIAPGEWKWDKPPHLFCTSCGKEF